MAEDNETKAEKFVRISESRLNRILEAFTILGKVSNVRDYDYTEAQARDLLLRLRSGISDLEAAFGVSIDAPAPELAADPGEENAGDPDPAQAPMSAPPGAAAASPVIVDLDALRAEVRSVDGILLRTAPGTWSGEDLIHVGPRLGLALEAAMKRDHELVVSLLSDVMRS